MSITRTKLLEFPGFAVEHNPKLKPFFVSAVLEDMRRIASKQIGKKLLKDIADARPRARTAMATTGPDAKTVKFDKGINVVIVPTSMAYTQSGYKMDWTDDGPEKSLVASKQAAHNVKGCPYHPAGGSCAEAIDITASGDGTGSVSLMKYTNAQVLTGKGEASYSFIVLAHELIHSLHHVTGTRKDNVEEQWTSGLGPYVDELMTENTFRRMFGIKLRDAF